MWTTKYRGLKAAKPSWIICKRCAPNAIRAKAIYQRIENAEPRAAFAHGRKAVFALIKLFQRPWQAPSDARRWECANKRPSETNKRLDVASVGSFRSNFCREFIRCRTIIRNARLKLN